MFYKSQSQLFTKLLRITKLCRKHKSEFLTKPYKLHNLETPPNSSSQMRKEEALKCYEQLYTIRRMEDAAGALYKQKHVRGFCHLYSGEEAVAVGIKSMMRPNDSIITGYRVHGWTYLIQESIRSVLAELVGTKSGCSRGKGGSMHMYGDRFYGGNGIVGAQVALGTGAALANKLQNTDAISFILYGDGAANQGQVFESFNMAKLWNLSCVYICENNGYGMGTPAQKSSASTMYYNRGDFIPGIRVDGMHLFSVREATRYAVQHCLDKKGPIVIECVTYRYSGHSMSDPGTSYRSRDEVTTVRKTQDPINTFRREILEAKLVNKDELDEIDKKIKKEIKEVTADILKEQEIDLKELTGDIYFKNYETEIRNVSPFLPLKHFEVVKRINK